VVTCSNEGGALKGNRHTGKQSIQNTVISGLSIFPNPASDRIFLRTNEDLAPSKVSVLDLMGKTLMVLTKPDDYNEIDIAPLANGMYFLKVQLGKNTVKTIRFIKE